MQKAVNKFLELLNNKDKGRTTCLIVFVDGSIDDKTVTDLQPAQAWCLDKEQTWNHCYTARYRADGKGTLLVPLIRQFVRDVLSTMDFSKKAPEESVGIISKADGQNWVPFEEALAKLHLSSDLPDSKLIQAFGSTLHSVLETGQRLILFCEVDGEPGPETLGLDNDSISALLEILPERFALVLAGVDNPPGPRAESFARIQVDQDYIAASPPEDRSQPLFSDRDEGDDALNVLSEVNALADAIASKDMDPPLVVGILGGWGSGKSYVMNLLKCRLLEIRHKNILDQKVRDSFPYVGHFYLVRFDAWTYAKADLWSSLMREVLLGLNDQIACEQLSVERPSTDSEDMKVLKIMEKVLGKRESFDNEAREELPEAFFGGDASEDKPTPEELTQYYLKLKRDMFNEIYDRLLTGADKFSPDVVLKLTGDDVDVQRIIDRLDNDILWNRLQALNESLQEQLEEEEKRLMEAKLKLADYEAKIAEKADLKLCKGHWETYAAALSGPLAELFRRTINDAQQKTKADEGIPFDEAIESVNLIKMIFAGKSARTVGAFIVFAIATALVAIFARGVADKWVTISTVLGGILGGGIEAWHRANRWMRGQVEGFYAFEKQLKAEQQERRDALILKDKSATDYQQQVQEVAELESKVTAYRNKVGLTAGHRTLLDFIANRIKEGDYEERLGPLHQVQKDMRQLSEGLKREELCVKDSKIGRKVDLEKLLFPRGAPRVVLLIDDLDRCPPTRVVEVLEAAQLLVKTSLFVVVLAMDVRYITKALEKAYEGVLDRRGAPSGLDYIEKIVQIPYRIRPISKDAMPVYLRSQMQLKAGEVKSPTVEGGLSYSEIFSHILAPGEGYVRIDDTIPQSVLAFEEEEIELIGNCALVVAISPRATKRLVNVMKLIKIIWYRMGLNDVSLDISKTVVFFLTFSARYAEIMRRVLLELERVVAVPKNSENKKKMAAFLSKVAKEWGRIEGRLAEWQFLLNIAKDVELMPSDMTLETLGIRNVELIRSFSFVGEVDMPPDPATHNVALELPEPVKICQENPSNNS